jgi:hypothetical protein
MNIVRALKAEEFCDVRVTCGWRWMYWNQSLQVWMVREHRPRERGSHIVIQTDDEYKAVQALVAD